MHQIIVVEDDPMVMTINRQYVSMNPPFHVCGNLRNGKDGLDFTKKRSVGPVILDYHMPLMNRTEFMERLNQFERKPGMIMVTTTNKTEMVKGLFNVGVIDYLVEPFECTRFERTPDQLPEKQELLSNVGGNLNQRDVDRLLSSDAANETGPAGMQKGLQEYTLETIRQYMKDNRGQPFTSGEITEQIHLFRTVTGRYVNYMLETHEIASSIDYKIGDRLSIQYRYVESE